MKRVKAVLVSYIFSMILALIIVATYSYWVPSNYEAYDEKGNNSDPITAISPDGRKGLIYEPYYHTEEKSINSTSPIKRTNMNITSYSGGKRPLQSLHTSWRSGTSDNWKKEVNEILTLNRCQVPPGGFRAWSEGVVTSLEPEVKVNCSRVISRDKKEINRVKSAMSGWKNALSDKELMRKMENCSWLRDYFSDNLYNSKLEKSFPIAFTFVVHDSPQQVLRLLRLLYRPQNSYCIHCDVKSPHKAFFQKIANCFENVITPSKVENVVWGYYTIMEAQMDCMTDLLKLRAKQEHKWRYVINLCGKELPLRTNREIVMRLMRLNGSSSIITKRIAGSRGAMKRIKYKVQLIEGSNRIKVQHDKRLTSPPFNARQFYKSSSYNAISLELAYYLIFDESASRIHNFFKMCKNSEEHFYATVYMMPGVPGGYNPRIPRDEYFAVEEAFWTKSTALFQKRKYRCHGMVRHDICIITASDLLNVAKERNYLFHNKYFMDVDHTVMKCMEERIVARNKLEYRKECII